MYELLCRSPRRGAPFPRLSHGRHREPSANDRRAGALRAPACSAADEPHPIAPRPTAGAMRGRRCAPMYKEPIDRAIDSTPAAAATPTRRPPRPTRRGCSRRHPIDVAIPPSDRIAAPARRFRSATDRRAAAAPIDAPPDQVVASCLVSFTVSGVAWSAAEGGHARRAVARTRRPPRRRRRQHRFVGADRRRASHRDFAGNLGGNGDVPRSTADRVQVREAFGYDPRVGKLAALRQQSLPARRMFRRCGLR